jgi:hypothetical protein
VIRTGSARESQSFETRAELRRFGTKDAYRVGGVALVFDIFSGESFMHRGQTVFHVDVHALQGKMAACDCPVASRVLIWLSIDAWRKYLSARHNIAVYHGIHNECGS